MALRVNSRSTARRLALAAAAAGLVVATTAVTGGAASAAPALAGPLSQSHGWITDSAGRAIVLHGLNLVGKVAPYTPDVSGFGDDDARFLADNGFDAVRVGVIWSAVEPSPGVYDDAYLAQVAATVDDLASHGIVSLLDFHQDLANEQFGGEGFPSWAVQTGGRPNIAAGFPFTYFVSPAELHTWDAFWANKPAPDGVGLQDHYAAAWAHVARYFASSPSVVGYEVMNEPWPGSTFPLCFVPLLGCANFNHTLTAFYTRVTTAIRTADPTRTVWLEPNTLFSYSDAPQSFAGVDDADLGFSFHDYCAAAELKLNAACPALDSLSVAAAKRSAKHDGVPWLLTEFGATSDTQLLGEMTSLADKNMLGWLEWAYTGKDDITTSDTGGGTEGLVRDPSLPPTGANVNTGNLDVLARPYPQAVSGTPTGWSFSKGTFTASWSTAMVSGAGRFGAGAETDIAVPAVQYPNGYDVHVTGGTVTSAPNTAVLQIAQNAGATAVSVTVTPHA